MPKKQSSLAKALIKKHKKFKKQFAQKHAHAQKFFKKKNLELDDIRSHSKRLLASATLGSGLLLASPVIPQLMSPHSAVTASYAHIQEFINDIKQIPQDHNFDEPEKIRIEKAIEKFFGIRATFSLDNNVLPTYVAKMGLEQHLYRYPGDTVSHHTAFQRAGIAPARGAFGYFVQEGISKDQAIENERYYVVLQTFMIPEWNRGWNRLKEWYRFRKFLVINPENGHAVVAVLGDSGPAQWTGKRFGGSPEVMYALGFYPKKTKGNVIVLFLDDPGNEVALGPVPLQT